MVEVRCGLEDLIYEPNFHISHNALNTERTCALYHSEARFRVRGSNELHVPSESFGGNELLLVQYITLS